MTKTSMAYFYREEPLTSVVGFFTDTIMYAA